MIFHENQLADDSYVISFIPYFCQKLGKISQNLLSAAVVIGALRVKYLFYVLFAYMAINVSFDKNLIEDRFYFYYLFFLSFLDDFDQFTQQNAVGLNVNLINCITFLNCLYFAHKRLKVSYCDRSLLVIHPSVVHPSLNFF